MLVQRNPVTGAPCGVTVDLARELERRLGVPLELVVIDGAGKSFEAVKTAACDIGFLAIEPARAAEIDFTAPYVIIEGVYAVRADTALQEERGRRPRRRARRGQQRRGLRPVPDALAQGRRRWCAPRKSFDVFLRDGLEAVAGVKQGVVRFVEANPAARLLPGRFMEIQQAMCLPKGRDAGARAICAPLSRR